MLRAFGHVALMSVDPQMNKGLGWLFGFVVWVCCLGSLLWSLLWLLLLFLCDAKLMRVS